MNKLSPVRQLTPDITGSGFFLCTTKEIRPGRNGEFNSLTLEDVTGRITGRVFDDVENLKHEFEAGEFVKAQGRTNLYNGRLHLVVDRIRRLIPEQDREQARLVKTLLSNCAFDCGSLCPSYNKPFDLFAKGTETGDWLAALDDFRNWLIKAA
jgi:hypothetical protein